MHLNSGEFSYDLKWLKCYEFNNFGRAVARRQSPVGAERFYEGS